MDIVEPICKSRRERGRKKHLELSGRGEGERKEGAGGKLAAHIACIA